MIRLGQRGADMDPSLQTRAGSNFQLVRLRGAPDPAIRGNENSSQAEFCQTGRAWLGCGHLRHQERQKGTGHREFYLIHSFHFLPSQGTYLETGSELQTSNSNDPLEEKIRAETKTDSGWAEARVDLFGVPSEKDWSMSSCGSEAKNLAEMGLGSEF